MEGVNIAGIAGSQDSHLTDFISPTGIKSGSLYIEEGKDSIFYRKSIYNHSLK